MEVQAFQVQFFWIVVYQTAKIQKRPRRASLCITSSTIWSNPLSSTRSMIDSEESKIVEQKVGLVDQGIVGHDLR